MLRPDTELAVECLDRATALFRPSSVRFTGHRRVHRVFLLAASASGSHDPAVGRRILLTFLSFCLSLWKSAEIRKRKERKDKRSQLLIRARSDDAFRSYCAS